MDLQRKLQMAVDAMVDKIDRERIRPIQRQTHMKIAECYNNKTATADEVEACANRCSVPVQNIQIIIQNEMNSFQSRVNRCAQDCSDTVNDEFRDSPNNASTQEAAQKKMHSCAQVCVDRHIALLKSLQSKIEKDIDQQSFK